MKNQKNPKNFQNSKLTIFSEKWNDGNEKGSQIGLTELNEQ